MRNRFGLGIALATVLASFVYAQPFTYQGMLKENGNPANGTLSMTFKLYDAPTEGNQIGSAITQDVSVQDGLFTVALDFGNVWNGADRYLEITVGSTVLSPRVKVNPVPYASFAQRPWQTSGTTIFYMDGRVGIGTNNPLALLHVNGDIRLADTDILNVDQLVGFNDLRMYGNISDTLGVPDLFIAGNGNVGIDTSSPIERLHVNGNIRLADDGDIFGLDQLVGYNDLRFYGDANGDPDLYIAPDGKVGIGTTNPFARLSLGGGDANTKLALWQGNTAAEVMGFGIAPNQFRLHLHHSGNRFSFLNAPNGTEIVTIKGDGNVGIGTTNPFERLHVEGNGVFSGRVGVGTTNPTRQLHVVGDSRFEGSGYVIGKVWIDDPTNNTTVPPLVVRSSNVPPSGSYALIYAQSTGTNRDIRAIEAETNSPLSVTVRSIAAADDGGWGIWSSALGTSGIAVVAQASQGIAVRASGKVEVSGNLTVSGNKSFQIDHPFHPETHYLNHFCTEGPEPYNAYSGIVVLDARGEAWVQLPNYFEAINRDPRYTLTPVGAPMPNLHIAQEIQGNRFEIAGGVPGKKVSWRIEAIRNDRWVQEYGFQTEQAKPERYQGKYLNPELYGQPEEKGIFYRAEPARPEPTPTRPNAK